MRVQAKYWLKYKGENTECLFRCNKISQMKKFVSENEIKDDDIIEIVRWA